MSSSVENEEPPRDVFGFKIEVGDVVCYAIAKGRTPVMRFAEVVTTPYFKAGRWKVRVRDIYSPQNSRFVCSEADAKPTVIEAYRRMFLVPGTAEQVRKHAKIADAEIRLARTAK